MCARSRLEDGWVYERPAGGVVDTSKEKKKTDKKQQQQNTRNLYQIDISSDLSRAKNWEFFSLVNCGSSSRRAPREAAGSMRGALTEAGLRLMRAVPPSLLQTAPALRISGQ